MSNTSQRLMSLDVLRGFDLFCLTILCPLVHAFNRTGEYAWMAPVMRQLDHVAWEGFTCWDLVMPLFMFMAGVSMPFAFARFLRGEESRTAIYRRIAKRVVVLWILGMVCQGNLLSLQWNHLKFYSNTLQAIAAGYLIASLLVLHFRTRGQLIATAALLLTYWGAMEFIRVGDFGGGNFTPGGNLAEWIDRVVLERWRDGAFVNENGQVVFPAWYNYTWILSTLNFGATVMTGVFAGALLKSQREGLAKVKYLLIAGAGMVVLGWLWGLEMPVIKRLWTSSMVLVSSGYCFLLMALFYYWIDYKKHQRGLTWLRVIGMNSILAYVLSAEVGVVHLGCIGQSVFFGLEQYIGPAWYHLLILSSNIALVYLLLWIMFRHRWYLRA